MSSYFFRQVEQNPSNAPFLRRLQDYSEENKQQLYVIDKPLGDNKYSYDYDRAFIILSPKHKCAFVHYGGDSKAYGGYVEDILEDLGSISDKYLYKETIGRPRTWKNNLFDLDNHIDTINDVPAFFERLYVENLQEQRKIDLIISLLIGSINDIEKVKSSLPETILDKVKQKIQLFDGDQTRFIYNDLDKKRITIQGLSGTGKTELLLHKLRDLYIESTDTKIFFTCFNKILADSLRHRIPVFFNFMKVEQQIEWNSRLWCTGSWGSGYSIDSGAYRYICGTYNIAFQPYSPSMSFQRACSIALNELRAKHDRQALKPAFDYMLIDESQDFPEEFIALCELVTAKQIFVAGDIFQSIFDTQIASTIRPDYLLGKCYRTDPKTLMFAHALGMGLFEANKLRWLDVEEWEACGYAVEVDAQHRFHLSREPLRRFEDLDDDFESVEIIDSIGGIVQKVIDVISEIRSENPTVQCDDIGVIFLDGGRYIYATADELEIAVQKKFHWKVNKSYETKVRKPDTLLISNRNNVKGLEFPFVICITTWISPYGGYRNALYTMLSRSFIKSYFVIPKTRQSGLTDNMTKGLEQILNTNEMIITEPSAEEKKAIRTRFETISKSKSVFEIVSELFAEMDIKDKVVQKRIFNAVQDLDLDPDPEMLREFIDYTIRYL